MREELNFHAESVGLPWAMHGAGRRRFTDMRNRRDVRGRPGVRLIMAADAFHPLSRSHCHP